MKIIGLIGGMSWESSSLYYQQINRLVQSYFGGLHSAKIVLYSIDFSHIAEMQKLGDWEASGKYLAEVAAVLESAGAECIALCTNTMHKVVEDIEKNISIPLLHIADATSETIIQDGLSKIGLLGTEFTMQESFYKDRLKQHGISILTPLLEEQRVVHNIIYEELCKGIITDRSKELYKEIMESLIERGAEGIILGCTEITMLVDELDLEFPIYDTTAIHAKKIALWSMGK